MIKSKELASTLEIAKAIFFDRNQLLKSKGIYQEWCTFVRQALNWVTAEGPQGLQRVKSIKLFMEHFVLYNEKRVFNQDSWISITTEGYPKGLELLCKKIYAGNLTPADIQSILSIMSVDRLILDSKLIPFDRPKQIRGISAPNRALASTEKITRDFDVFLTKFMDLVKEKKFSFYDRMQEPFKPAYGTYSSEKRGPNGVVCETVYADLLSIIKMENKMQNRTILSNVIKLGELVAKNTSSSNDVVFDSNFSTSVIEAIRSSTDEQYVDLMEKAPDVISGRLSSFAARGGKTRTIALSDQFSQTVLRPIHHKLMNILRSIPQDCTFRQEKGIEALTRFTGSGNYLASLDLSSATDRFPITMQCIAMDFVFRGETEMTDLWQQVIANRTFSTSGVINLVETSYSVGQPMGSYSSWAAFTLTHHLVVQFAASLVRSKLSWFTGYRLLGDDVFIADRKVADKYRELMNGLGVDISIEKSHISGKGTDRPSAGEFAKKLAHKGFDVSPISLSQLLAAQRNAASFVNLVIRLRSSNINVKLKSLKRLIKTLHPRDAKILDLALTLPVDTGGAGLRDQRTKGIVLSPKSQSGQLILARLALKVKSYAVRENSYTQADRNNNIGFEEWVPDWLLRKTLDHHPIVKNNRIAARESSYSFIPSVPLVTDTSVILSDLVAQYEKLDLGEAFCYEGKSYAPITESVKIWDRSDDSAREELRLWRKAQELAESFFCAK